MKGREGLPKIERPTSPLASPAEASSGFQLSEDQRLLKKTVRDFAERELKPHAREWDEKQEFPREIFRKLGRAGPSGVVFPEEYGGSGMSTVDYTIVIEELARVDAGVALSTAAHNSLSSGHIFLAGTEEQKKKYLPKLATGEFVGAWGLTENSAGSDAGGTRTTAVKDGDSWVLNGSKTFITNGSLADVVRGHGRHRQDEGQERHLRLRR